MPQKSEAYINIQGDEPYIDPLQIDQVCEILRSRTGAFVGTLVKRLADLGELQNPNTIKAVFALDGQAINSSRSPIPYMRDTTQEAEFLRERGYFKHIGIYGYSKEGLSRIRGMQRGMLEKANLRAIAMDGTRHAHLRRRNNSRIAGGGHARGFG